MREKLMGIMEKWLHNPTRAAVSWTGVRLQVLRLIRLRIPVAPILHGGTDMETNTKRRKSPPHSFATAANAPKPQPAAPVGALLTPQQLAERLAVPPSWIREKSRTRARVRDSDPLPIVKLGKYVRFRWAEVEAWLARQSV
jgi:hypothetical protein